MDSKAYCCELWYNGAKSLTHVLRRKLAMVYLVLGVGTSIDTMSGLQLLSQPAITAPSGLVYGRLA